MGIVAAAPGPPQTASRVSSETHAPDSLRSNVFPASATVCVHPTYHSQQMAAQLPQFGIVVRLLPKAAYRTLCLIATTHTFIVHRTRCAPSPPLLSYRAGVPQLAIVVQYAVASCAL